MFESRRQPPLSRQSFTRRLLLSLAIAAAFVVVSLGIGMAGYIRLEHLAPIDAFLNAAMLLGGMGPVDAPKTSAGKLFAGLYALYAGLVFLITAALAFTPIIHRLLHTFHWSEEL